MELIAGWIDEGVEAATRHDETAISGSRARSAACPRFPDPCNGSEQHHPLVCRRAQKSSTAHLVNPFRQDLGCSQRRTLAATVSRRSRVKRVSDRHQLERFRFSGEVLGVGHHVVDVAYSGRRGLLPHEPGHLTFPIDGPHLSEMTEHGERDPIRTAGEIQQPAGRSAAPDRGGHPPSPADIQAGSDRNSQPSCDTDHV